MCRTASWSRRAIVKTQLSAAEPTKNASLAFQQKISIIYKNLRSILLPHNVTSAPFLFTLELVSISAVNISIDLYAVMLVPCARLRRPAGQAGRID